MKEPFKYQANTEKEREEIQESIEKNATKDIEMFFEGFLKSSSVVRTKKFSGNLSVTLAPCTVQQLLEAELFIRGNNPGIPVDTMIRLRSCSILSYAIKRIGSVEICNDEDDAEKQIARRLALYQQLLSLPPALIREIYDFYLETVEEQEKLFSDPKAMNNKIENF